MFRSFLAILSVSLLLGCAAEALAQNSAPQPLPIKRVVLYKHGVGYFEREGAVDGTADVALRFKTDQMNDLLKSLTVLDLGGGTIQSIGYESTKTVAQQLGEYTFNLQSAGGLPAILEQMKGAEVVLQVPAGPVTGRVLAIEKHNVRKGETVTEEYRLSVLLEDGSVRSYDLSEIAQIEFKDPRLQAEMQKYLQTLFSRHRRDEKQVVIHAAGKGKRDLFASYIQEQPVWKVSYRIVLSDKKNEQPLLQGWAIVDNVSGEEWKDVDLALVSGLPVSFVQNLYDPWYVKRPTLALTGAQVAAPVTYAAGEELMEADANVAGGAVAAEMEGARKDKAELFSRKAVAGRAMAAPAAAPMPNMMLGMQQQVSAAAAQAMGALFRYDIKEPVTIASDRSAMLPIVNSRIEARRVSIYDQSVRRDNPMDGLLLRNTTGLTLEGGPITVYEQDTYSGEALIETFTPAGKADPKAPDTEKKDQRLISFAVDLGTRVNPVAGTFSQDFWQLRVLNGVMYADYRQRQTTVYNLNNVESKEKSIVIQHPFRPDWKLVDTDKPMEQTAQFYRFDVPLAANKQAAFKVTEENPGSTTIAISNANPDLILFYARQKYVDSKTKDFLEKVAKLQGEIAELNRQSQELERQKTDIAQSQNRVRQNMQALGGTEQERTLRARYVKDFEDQENKFKDASEKQDALKTQIEAKTKELKALIAGYTFVGK